MDEHANTAVKVSGAIEGDYVIEDARTDGRLVLRPDLSVGAILARHGATALTRDEADAALGSIPTDDEG